MRALHAFTAGVQISADLNTERLFSIKILENFLWILDMEEKGEVILGDWNKILIFLFI